MIYIRRTAWYRWNPALFETLFAWLRLMIVVYFTFSIGLLGVNTFENVDLIAKAATIQPDSPLLMRLPTWLVAWGLFFSTWSYFRYLLAPLNTLILVIIAGAFYIRDIYALPRISMAFRYLLPSLFGFFYPAIEIDGGKVREDEKSVLERVGGPGYVMIQPGNAVIFRELRRPSNIALPRRYFMRPFEQIGAIASLDEQEGYEKEVIGVTHDGIQVTIRDIHYRYKLQSERKSGSEVRRSTSDPYPFSQAAMLKMAYNRVVTEDGEETWHSAVQKTVKRTMAAFIGKSNLDHITAPRLPGENPRRELQTQLFAAGVRDALTELGAELLWIDTGHFDILEFDDLANENVDQQRFAFWASRWIGNDKRVRAMGDAQRMALQERGRSEAQAELLRNITASLREANLQPDHPENVRKILLVRTAQILEGMRDIKTWKRETK